MVKWLNSKYGIQQANKSINQLHQYIIDVILFITVESEVALCVYDISNRNSFLVMNKWVK
jgi:hypothetical protein